MIKVENLKKLYGNFEALKGVSFEVKKSKITALLGPNGAGKTTTLRILSGYLTYNDGNVEINGKKLNKDNLKDIKKDIGYIPENNPVYEDLEITDYLSWVASVYSIDRNRVKDVIEKCSLKDVLGKKIFELSKGYKQRVSLAKAILHNPSILLLDEPTTGLDPNQARQTRELIKGLSLDKTIVISTHILSEVEMLADEIIIINNGVIAEIGTKEEIVEKYNKNTYIIKAKNKELKLEMNEIKNFEVIKQSEDEYIYKVEFNNNLDMRKPLLDYVLSKNIEILEFYKERITLDEIFKKITEQS